MRIGVSTWLWTSPLTTAEAERLVPLLARMGYDCVELPLEDVAAVDAARVLRVASDHGDMDGWPGYWPGLPPMRLPAFTLPA